MTQRQTQTNTLYHLCVLFISTLCVPSFVCVWGGGVCVCVCVRACVCTRMHMHAHAILCACVFAMFCMKMFVNFHMFCTLVSYCFV